MSKKVTIPTDGGNPFVVILGGIKYVYKPGETVDVPDGVALEIEEWERWRDKYRGAVQPPFAAGDGGVQPDLSQNDPNAADYVKNRTHWAEDSEFLYAGMPNHPKEFDTTTSWLHTFSEGEIMGVEINGIKHYCEVKRARLGEDSLYVGNQSIASDIEFSEPIVSDEPFFIYFGTNGTIFKTTIEADNYTWNIYKRYKEYHPLDIEYLPYEVRDKLIDLTYLVELEGGADKMPFVDTAPEFWALADYYGSLPIAVKVSSRTNMCVYEGMFVKIDLSEMFDDVFKIHFMYGDSIDNLTSATITHGYGESPTVSVGSNDVPQ